MPNRHDSKRRALLKGAGITALTLGASFVLPTKWIKPIAEVGVLPAHAQTTCSCLAQFRITLEEPIGNISPTVFTGSTTLEFSGPDPQGAVRWLLEIVGDTSCLPDQIWVTGTQSLGSLDTSHWLSDQPNDTVSDFFPLTGGSIGNGGTYRDTGDDQPYIRATGPGQSGVMTLSADCIETMVVTIQETSVEIDP